MALCPTCHSNIGTGSLSEAQREQGVQGTDTNGLPVPRWSDDPLLTAGGLSGDSFSGRNFPRLTHIQELQERINDLEDEAGLPLTEFSDVTDEVKLTRRHIVELREATERLLNFNDQTLEDYFKNDDAGEPVTQNPNLVNRGATDPQTEWVDVNRGEVYLHLDNTISGTFALPDGSTADSPTLPRGTGVRAVHIEDLRHPIAAGTFSILVTFLQASGTSYVGRKDGKANFKGVKLCMNAS